MIGFLSLSSSFSRFFDFFFFFAWKKALKKELSKETWAKTKEGERSFFWLSSVSKKQKAKISSRMKKYLGGKRRQKEDKKHPKRKKIFSLSLCFSGGRASSLLPSSSSTSSAVFVKHRAAREERKHIAARGRKKTRYLNGGERKCCWAFYWSREVCLRARFPPRISHSWWYKIGLFFRQFFFFFGGKTALLKPSFSPLIFFFCRFGKKGTKRRKINTKKVRREYVERRRLSI